MSEKGLLLGEHSSGSISLCSQITLVNPNTFWFLFFPAP